MFMATASQLVPLDALLLALASLTLLDEHYFSTTAYRAGAGAAHPVSTTASV